MTSATQNWLKQPFCSIAVYITTISSSVSSYCSMPNSVFSDYEFESGSVFFSLVIGSGVVMIVILLITAIRLMVCCHVYRESKPHTRPKEKHSRQERSGQCTESDQQSQNQGTTSCISPSMHIHILYLPAWVHFESTL